MVKDSSHVRNSGITHTVTQSHVTQSEVSNPCSLRSPDCFASLRPSPGYALDYYSFKWTAILCSTFTRSGLRPG